MHEIRVDVAVIGAGTAGLAAYRAAAAAGKRALIIEGGPYGTTCARVGCMPSKLLIAAAEAAHGPSRWAELGLRLKGELEGMAGGRVYTGTRALELGLVDELGGLGEAIAYAAEKAGVDANSAKLSPEPKSALEGLFAILAVHHRTAPAAINIDDPDPKIDLDVVRGEHRTLPDGDIAVLNNSFGFGGHNVALVVTSV